MDNVRSARDTVLLITRVALGAIFIAHGWQKLSTNGIDETATTFDGAGVPLPTASAWATSILEIAGGIALIAGAAVAIVGLLFTIEMIGAYLFVHMGEGLFVTEGGFELVAALGVASLMLATFGAGRFSVDHAVASRTTEETGQRRRRHTPSFGH
jgi:putative oxidoreductase